MSSNVHHGVVHGRTIQLDSEPGLPTGQPVEVTIVPTSTASAETNGLDRLRQAAGGWCESEDELDRYLAWNRLERKSHRREIAE